MLNKNPLFALFLLSVMMINTSEASVRTLGKATVVNDSNGNSFKQVSVTCRNFSDTRFLRQPVSGGKWCDSKQPDFCASQAIKAANKVCSKRYMDALNDSVPKTIVKDTPIKETPKSVAPSNSDSAVVAEPQVDAPTPIVEKQIADNEPTALEQERNSLEEERLSIKRKQDELEQRKQRLLEDKKKLEANL